MFWKRNKEKQFSNRHSYLEACKSVSYLRLHLVLSVPSTVYPVLQPHTTELSASEHSCSQVVSVLQSSISEIQHKNYNIGIYHEEDRLEKSVPRITVWHHKAC